MGLDHAIHTDYRHIHRDIKPANMMYSSIEKTLNIVDFGLFMAVSAQSPGWAGTRGYLPLEALQGKASEKSDIYALGRTLQDVFGIKDEVYSAFFNRRDKFGYVDNKAEQQFDSRTFQELQLLTKDMVNENHHNRSTLPEIISALKNIYRFHFEESAKIAFAQKNYALAIQNYEKIINRIPGYAHKDLYYQLGNCHLQTENYQKAADCYLKAFLQDSKFKQAKDAHHSITSLLQARAQVAQQDYVSAFFSYKEASRLNSSLGYVLTKEVDETGYKASIANYISANEKVKLGDYENAKKLYSMMPALSCKTKVESTNALSALNFLKNADQDFVNKKYPEAIEYYQKAKHLNHNLAVKITPLISQARDNDKIIQLVKQGDFAFKQMNFEKAIGFYRAVTLMNPAMSKELPNLLIAKQQLDFKAENDRIAADQAKKAVEAQLQAAQKVDSFLQKISALELKTNSLCADSQSLLKLNQPSTTVTEIQSLREKIIAAADILKTLLSLEIDLTSKDLGISVEVKEEQALRLLAVKQTVLANFISKSKPNSLPKIMKTILENSTSRAEYENYLAMELLSIHSQKVLKAAHQHKREGRIDEAIVLFDHALILARDADVGLCNIILAAQSKYSKTLQAQADTAGKSGDFPTGIKLYQYAQKLAPELAKNVATPLKNLEKEDAKIRFFLQNKPEPSRQGLFASQRRNPRILDPLADTLEHPLPLSPKKGG